MHRQPAFDRPHGETTGHTTTALSRNWALAIGALLCLSSYSAADTPPPPPGSPYPLPAELEASFASTSYSTKFHVTAAGGAEANIYAWFSTTAPSGKVHLKTIYHGPTSASLVRTDTYSTSFQPTALTKRSGNTDTLYIAGWLPRQRMAVVEEWKLEHLALGETLLPTGETKASMSAPQFTKRLLVVQSGDSARPIETLACDPYSNELLVLEYGPEARLSRVNLNLPIEDMSLIPVADISSLPELENTRFFKTGFHEQHGLVIVLKRARAWKLSPKSPIYAMYDTNGDGWLDLNIIIDLSPAAWTAQFPDAGWLKHW